MVTIEKMDWKLLANQKEHLCQILYNNAKPDADLIEGLLEMIDNIQDESDELGYPVVFIPEDWQGEFI